MIHQEKTDSLERDFSRRAIGVVPSGALCLNYAPGTGRRIMGKNIFRSAAVSSKVS